MIEHNDIAGYCRISVDEELDRDNISIENQKAIIADFVKNHFPNSSLTFYQDRDRSGYTFEQRENYQTMRRGLMTHQYNMLIVKDFSRFSRRNSRGLVELEDLRDAGARIISIGDGVDFPNDDDWLKIQFQFLINEMPVTDASKKVKSVVKRRQEDGKWICAAPYGYIVNKQRQFEVVSAEADVVRKIFTLYNDGWGYKRIANYLTDEGIPTPRMAERERMEADGLQPKRKARPVWAIITVQGILDNDFYIGTLRQGKYTRKKINGADKKLDESEHLVFENNHQAIIDYCTFATTKALREKRTTSSYRGIKINDNIYSGFLFCGDCASPMFALSRRDISDAYRCGEYHKRGLKGCTSHYIRVDKLDELIKAYVRKIANNSKEMIERLNLDLAHEDRDIAKVEQTAEHLSEALNDLREELKSTKRQRVRDIMKHPENEEILDETYDEIESDILRRIDGLQNQISMAEDDRNTIIRVNRIAKVAMDVFRDILEKPKIERNDLELIVDRIEVYKDHIDVRLKADVDSILQSGTLALETEGMAGNFNLGIVDSLQTQIVQTAAKHLDKVYDVNVVNSGDPLEIYTDRDGEVILKKYSPIGEMSSFAKDYTESLFRSLGHIACIVDRDQVVAASGVSKKELWDKPISHDLETAIAGRQTVTMNRFSGGKIVPVTSEEDMSGYTAQVVSPIIADGEAIGAVLLLSREQGAKMGDTEIKVAETAAGIVGRQMEQ